MLQAALSDSTVVLSHKHLKRMKMAEQEQRAKMIEEEKKLNKKTENGKKAKNTEDDEYVGIRPLHRSMFNRRVSLPNFALSGGLVQRYYFDDKKEFNKLLKAFVSHHNITLQRVGYANTYLHFCVRCYDANKLSSTDLYYVDRTSKTKTPKSFCLGCLGALLREYKTKEDNNETRSREESGPEDRSSY